MECQLFTKSLISFPTSDILFICIVVDIIIMRDGQISLYSLVVSNLNWSHSGRYILCTGHCLSLILGSVHIVHFIWLPMKWHWWLITTGYCLQGAIYEVTYILCNICFLMCSAALTIGLHCVVCNVSHWVALSLEWPSIEWLPMESQLADSSCQRRLSRRHQSRNTEIRQ